MENGPFIDGLKNGWSFHGELLNNRMVILRSQKPHVRSKQVARSWTEPLMPPREVLHPHYLKP